MSAFLGPIHYWLYNKIEVEEDILQNIIDFTTKKGNEITALTDEANNKFGSRTVGNLEDNINQDNIHGWLQSKITSVESRLSYIVTNLLSDSKITVDEINEIFKNNGIECAKKSNITDITPGMTYQEIYNNLLAGMPCDRVNEVVENTPSFVKWKTTIDIHKEYWDSVSGNVEYYHTFEENWIKSFVNEISSKFEYKKEGGLNIIQVK